jgi:hypothetical protein
MNLFGLFRHLGALKPLHRDVNRLRLFHRGIRLCRRFFHVLE